MEVFWDAALAFVCVLGLAFGAWWLFGLLLRPLPGCGAAILIPGRGEGERLEQLVRAVIWLRGMGLVKSPVLIADVSLSPAGRELALRLAARWPGVMVWPAGELEDCLGQL